MAAVFGTTATAFVLPARYPFGDSITTSQAQFSESSVGRAKHTAEVGKIAPNDWSLYDMHGNVWGTAGTPAMTTPPQTGDAEELLRAASQVLGSTVPLEPERAEANRRADGCACELADYDDAGRAVRRWFALMAEPGNGSQESIAFAR